MRISDLSSDVCSSDLIGACLIAVRSVIEFDALRFRIEKWEDLWIVQKQVDVVTFTMIDLQHQCGSAAEAPLRREAVRLPEMVKNIYGEIEKDRPFARPLCRHGVRPPAVACSPKVRRFYRRLGSLDLRLRPSLP